MIDGPAYKRSQVAEIINSVLAKIDSPQKISYDVLSRELQHLKNIIEDLHRQLHSTHASDIGETHIPNATDELGAVVLATEQATEKIMESCENILEVAKSAESEVFNQVETSVIKIFEACTFQDITGQRIKKVTNCLRDIEAKTASVLQVIQGNLGGIQADNTQHVVTGSDSLLNGPALPAHALLQDDIDRILAEFDAKN